MKNYKLFLVSLYFLIELIINKAEWVELPQFSNNEKIYRASFQLDRFFQSSRNKSGIKLITRPVVQSNFQRVDKFQKVPEIEKTIYRKGLEQLIINDTSCTTTALPITLTTESFKKSATVTSIVQYENFDKNQRHEETTIENDAPVRNLIIVLFNLIISNLLIFYY